MSRNDFVGVKKALAIIAGFAIALGSIWIGSYLLHELAITDWRAAPTFITAFTTFTTGVALAGWGATL